MTQTIDPETHARPAGERFLRRWLSLGGLVTVVGLGNLVAALNYNAISGGLDDIRVVAATERYAIWGFALLIVGQAMVTRRTILETRG